jgi:D-alanyl-D-alanine carboxypeptidase
MLSMTSIVACNETKGPEKPPVNDPFLLLVNKQNKLEESFVPEGLITLDSNYTTGAKEIMLNQTAAEAVLRMLDAMAADGIDNVSVTSAYRTYDYQQKLFNKYIAAEKAAHPDFTDDEVRELVLTYSAAPGTSEHQSGLCVDFFTTEMEGLWNYGSETPKNPYDKGFAETDAFEWLQQHAHEYGFIIRFPEDKTDITGYSYESWHYRYVGVEHATKIHEQGITLEEYLDSLK